MNITTLKTFLTVVELKNLNKAARRLNVTQSTVSARIDALEHSLGQKLLVRSRRCTQMPKAGFALQRHAENTVQAWEAARRAVEFPGGFESSVSISCEHDLWEGNAESWLRAVAEANPLLAIEVWPGARIEIEAWLGSGLIDAAITREPIAGEGIATRLFAQDALVHLRSAKADSKLEYITVDHGPGLRRQIAVDNKPARLTYGAGGSRWALDQIQQGRVSGYLPEKMVTTELERGSLIRVPDSPTYRLDSHLSWRRASAEDHPWLTEPI